uniref:Ig-like domain-containing protein n=1 Tax=Dicentrarchus labrax TaxID=13489 RepID=A0A8P4GMZ4_DICLA
MFSVSLPRPSISMNPAGEVTWGQDVAITCSITTQHLGGTFILQKTSGSFRKTQTSSTNSVTFSILKVNFDNEGAYQCQYQTQISSRDFSSPLSDSVRLSVTVSLPKPSISMNPAGEVTWGQDVGFTCSISTQHLGGTFILQKTSGSFRKTQMSSSNSVTFSFLKVNFDHEGSYQCQYQTQVSSRDFSSPFTDSVRLSVSVPLLQPSINLTSPNKGLAWGSEGAEVTRGYSFVITCSISSHYPGGVFSLIFSGSNITDAKPAVNNSASFNFPVAEYEHQGNYSCVYEVTLSSRKFTSTETTLISVIITLPLLLLVSTVVAGILLVPLLVPLLVLVVVFLVLRRRRGAREPGAHFQTQLSVRNHHEDFEEEEEEERYRNFEEVHECMRQEQTRGMEEEDGDEDHDYGEEEDNGHNHVGSEDIYALVEGQGEDDEDSDDDYVNVQQPFDEDTLDIYGEHEDIYQNI